LAVRVRVKSWGWTGVGCALWGVTTVMWTIGPCEVRVVPTKEAAVSCEWPRAVWADSTLMILQHFDHGASLVPLGGVASGLILD
jgi:hypothetical protein